MTRTTPIRRPPPLPAALTPQEVAAAVRIDVRSVYRAIERRELRAVRLGGNGPLRVPPSALPEWIRPAVTEEV